MKPYGIIAFLSLVCIPAAAQPAQEMRGAWIATVGGIDWPAQEENCFTQRANLIDMIRDLGDMGCNTVFFQVVSEMDAMYSSDLLPWSRELTGTEGEEPFFDPLSVAVMAAHEYGMKIHAWINPLRVSRSDTTSRAPDCIKHVHPEWVKNVNGREYLDPGYPEVAEFLSGIVSEILTRYDVDGIHIDDYFYPDGLQKDDSLWDDGALYKLHGGGKSLQEWRYCNIDRIVRTLYDTVHGIRPEALFGVSPSGLMANTSRLYADPRRWVAEGYPDYLVPQIYWSTDRGDHAAFGSALAQWKDLGVPVYAGLAAYKHEYPYYRNRKDAAFKDLGEFAKEIEVCRSSAYINGHVWFRARFILKDDFRDYISGTLYAEPPAQTPPKAE